MIKFLKRQWLRLKSSWEAFKIEWRIKWRIYFCNLQPPYYGRIIVRLNGHVFTLKHTHYNPTTGVVRYLDTDKPADGFVVLDANWLEGKND